MQPMLTGLESTANNRRFAHSICEDLFIGWRARAFALQVADPGPCENDPEVSCGQSKTLCGHVKCECQLAATVKLLLVSLSARACMHRTISWYDCVHRTISCFD